MGVRVVGHPSRQYYITVAGQRVDALSQVAPIGRSAATTGRQKTRSEDVGASGWRAKCEEKNTFLLVFPRLRHVSAHLTTARSRDND